MSETYLIKGDDYLNLTNLQWGCQSFRPTIDHTLFYVDLDLELPDLTHDPYVEVWSQKPDPSHPEYSISHSTDLMHLVYQGYDLWRVRAVMTEVLLEKGHLYYLTLHQKPPPPPTPNRWTFDSTASLYKLGARYVSTDGGYTWSIRPNTDFIFGEFGPPYTPPIAEPPPALNYLITDLTLADLSYSACITLYTNVPCTLVLYWTTRTPDKVPITTIRRGLPLTCDCDHAMLAVDWINQREIGDSLTHTFPVPDWPQLQQRWFVPSAKMVDLASLSAAPIFSWAHPGNIKTLNLDFEDWPDPHGHPRNWNPFTFGSGFFDWWREENIQPWGGYAAGFSAGGYNAGCGYRQYLDATPYRGQHLKFRAMGYGYAEPNNCLYVRVDGTDGWGRWNSLTANYAWQEKEVEGDIPWDANSIGIEVRCYSPGYGPIKGVWDGITIDA